MHKNYNLSTFCVTKEILLLDPFFYFYAYCPPTIFWGGKHNNASKINNVYQVGNVWSEGYRLPGNSAKTNAVNHDF